MVEPVTIYRTAGETITLIDMAVAPPPAPTITNLRATPPALPFGGGTTTIDATVTNATTVQLDGLNATLPIPVATAATRTYTLTARGPTAPPAQSQVTVTVAVTPPPGETITVDAATTYQTMMGWEAHARAWEEDKVADRYDGTWRAECVAVADYLVNQVGLNRIQVPLRSGWINPADYFAQWAAGQLTYTQWDVLRYEKIAGAYQWSEFDFKVETSAVPMAAALAKRGEKLYVNLGVVDFNVVKYAPYQGSLVLHADAAAYAAWILACFDRLKTKYGITADALELNNEPENTAWNGTEMGAALVAAKAVLDAAGFTGINYIGPSCSSAGHTQTYANAMLAVPGAAQALTTLSYHRYDSPSAGIVSGLYAYAQSNGLKTDMSEWINAKADTLMEDLTAGNVSSWQKWAVAQRAGRGSSPQSFYVHSDAAGNITPAPNTAPMTAVMRYVRMGAVRVKAVNVGAPRSVVAFVNTDGQQVVVIKAGAAGLVTVKGLKPGLYGVHEVSTSDVALDLPDWTAAVGVGTTINVIPGMTTLYGKSGPVVIPPGALSVTLDFGSGSIARYDSTRAVDQGRFVGEFVKQDCALDVDPAFPDWRVYFRRDVAISNAREEVVFEYGRTTAGHAVGSKVVPTRSTPYTATITRDGVVLYSVTVPRHFGYSRWRWQSSERPVVRTPAMLKARNWIPNFGPGGLFGAKPSQYGVPWPGPMSMPGDEINPATGKRYGGFSPAMARAGSNWQIGYLTTAAVEYILHELPQSLVTVRTEGEWCGNWVMHMRDDATGAPLDVRGKALRTKGNSGTINDPPSYPTGTPLPSGFVTLDESHRYPLYILPWLLTDDPFFLEELQFGANRHILMAQYHRTQNKLQGMVYPGSQRAMAWGLRDLFYTALTTPAIVPSWLLPNTYWDACVADNHTYSMKYVNAPARIHALFKTWTRTDADPAWMTCWLNAVCGMAVGMGFTEWSPIFQWGVDKHIQQTNGTSGWPRQWPVPYYSIPDKAAVWATPTNLMPPSSDATVCLDWADYWAYFKSGSPDKNGVGHSNTDGSKVDDSNWPDDHTIMQTQSGPSYFLDVRSVLAMAVTRGIPGAQACYDYIQSELPAQMTKYRSVGNYPFSLDP